MQDLRKAGDPVLRARLLVFGQVLADELDEDEEVSVDVPENVFDRRVNFDVGEVGEGHLFDVAEDQDEQNLLLADELLGGFFLEEELHLEDRGFVCLDPPVANLLERDRSVLVQELQDVKNCLFFFDQIFQIHYEVAFLWG